jgi:hypothetical protein
LWLVPPRQLRCCDNFLCKFIMLGPSTCLPLLLHSRLPPSFSVGCSLLATLSRHHNIMQRQRIRKSKFKLISIIFGFVISRLVQQQQHVSGVTIINLSSLCVKSGFIRMSSSIEISLQPIVDAITTMKRLTTAWLENKGCIITYHQDTTRNHIAILEWKSHGWASMKSVIFKFVIFRNISLT